MRSSIRNIVAVLLAACVVIPLFAAKSSYVDITWMSIANMYYEIGGRGIITDGYFSRIPQDQFYGGGGGLAWYPHGFNPPGR